jgi:hypothetical protein
LVLVLVLVQTNTDVTRVLQECSEGVTRMLRGCNKGVTRVLQEYHEGVTRVLQGYYKVTSKGCMSPFPGMLSTHRLFVPNTGVRGNQILT